MSSIEQNEFLWCLSGPSVASVLSLSLTSSFICVSTSTSISNIQKVYREKDTVVEALRGDIP